MDFSWSQEQLGLKNRVIEFSRKELNNDLVTRDRKGKFSRENWKKCGQFGIQGIAMPKEYNGKEEDILTVILAMEGLGYGSKDNGLNFGLNAQMWTVQFPILKFGNENQKRMYLPGLCNGSLIGAHAMTEANAGSDVFNLSTSAEKHNGGYVLRGTKKFVTLSTVADFALVYATVNPSLGKWGISAFIVPLDSPGIRVRPAQEKMGLRTVPFGEINLENCFVPEENRLGPEGAGVSMGTNSLEWERCCILATQLGAMERQLEESIAYAKKRRQFNQPIGDFQSVSNRIADMKLRLETARLLVYKAGWLKKIGKSALMEASLSKLHLSECFTYSSFDAIRNHGGLGYLRDFEVERDLRDAIGGTIYGGTSDIQRNIVAKLLGL